jgi:hypothetical protein
MTIYMLARNLVANRAEGFFLLIFLHQHVYERLEVKENLCSLLVSAYQYECGQIRRQRD